MVFKKGNKPIKPFKKGNIPWNKGKKIGFTWNKGLKGIIKSNSTSFKKGNIPWNKGIPRTKEEKKYISKRRKEMMTQEIKEKISKALIGIKVPSRTGENHPKWIKDRSFLIYPDEFSEELKEQIRKRDNFTCQECRYTQEQLGYIFSIHHVDYNKQNNNPKNLISLCKSCHAKTNYTREEWIDYFKEKVIT